MTRRLSSRISLADLFGRRDDDEPWPEPERPAWPRPPQRTRFEDPRDAIPVRWLPVSNSRDQLIDSKLAAYLSCAASEDSAFTSALHSGYHGGYHAMRERTGRAWREYMSALLFGYWPDEGRLALPAPVPARPGGTPNPPDVPDEPYDAEIIIVDGGHITIPYTETPPGHPGLDPEPLPDLPRPDPIGQCRETPAFGPGQPGATVSFQVTGETQPFDRYAALRPENLDAENEDTP